MMAHEAMEIIRALQRRYGQAYKWGEWEPYWSRMLVLDREDAQKAVSWVMDTSQRLPDPGYVLGQMERWQRQGMQSLSPSDGDEGAEWLRLFQSYTAGRMTKREYAEGLMELSQRYQREAYAQEAARVGG